MKTSLTFAISLLIISTLYGQSGEKANTTIKTIDLLAPPASTLVNLSDIAIDVEYIPLQTTGNSLIERIGKIITCENRIYIKNGLEVMCFDKEGHFLYKLDKSGRGPGEYTFIIDFDISSDNKTLLVLSSLKILEFKNTGTEFAFLKSINLKRPSPSKLDMVPGTNNVLLSIDPLGGYEASLSVLINLNGDTLYFKPNCYKYEKIDKMTIVHIWESLHYKFNNSVCFREEFSDTIFSVNGKSNNFIPILILDSHGKILPPKGKGDREYAKRHSGEFTFVYTILEVPRYIIYLYEHNLSKYKVIYDKSVNKKFEIELKNALKDDLSGGPNFDPNFCNEGKLYSSVEALTLKKYVASEDFAKVRVRDLKKKDGLKALADKLNETDNPVLIIVTPKK